MIIEQLDIHLPKKLNADTDLLHFTKVNSKQITELSVTLKTRKPLEDHTGENLDAFGCDDAFLDTPSKAGSMKESTDELNFIKSKIFLCSQRQCQEKEKTSHRLGEKHLQKIYLIKDCYP